LGVRWDFDFGCIDDCPESQTSCCRSYTSLVEGAKVSDELTTTRDGKSAAGNLRIG